jgi:hypothetical protein
MPAAQPARPRSWLDQSLPTATTASALSRLAKSMAAYPPAGAGSSHHRNMVCAASQGRQPDSPRTTTLSAQAERAKRGLLVLVRGATTVWRHNAPALHGSVYGANVGLHQGVSLELQPGPYDRIRRSLVLPLGIAPLFEEVEGPRARRGRTSRPRSGPAVAVVNHAPNCTRDRERSPPGDLPLSASLSVRECRQLHVSLVRTMGHLAG